MTDIIGVIFQFKDVDMQHMACHESRNCGTNGAPDCTKLEPWWAL